MNLKNTTILDSKDEDELPSLEIALQNITKLPSKDKILYKKVRTQINMNSESTIILDLDEENKLPSLETALLNITKFTGSKKINIELQNDTIAANSNNDDFIYTINNRSLRISKKKIRSKLKSMVQKLKTKKVLEDIAKICEYKERCKYYNDFKSLSKWQLYSPLAIFQRINHLVPGYYGMKGYMIMYEHLMKNTEWKLKDIKFIKFIEEVIIPELGVRFIIEDLGVDYDTAVTIT
ncbi:21207_t:CDS:1, partial [Gigaspora margarita]